MSERFSWIGLLIQKSEGEINHLRPYGESLTRIDLSKRNRCGGFHIGKETYLVKTSVEFLTLLIAISYASF